MKHLSLIAMLLFGTAVFAGSPNEKASLDEATASVSYPNYAKTQPIKANSETISTYGQIKLTVYGAQGQELKNLSENSSNGGFVKASLYNQYKDTPTGMQ